MPEHRSVSQLTSYASCGESYRLSKVARAPQTPAAWFAQGVAVHAAIERWERTYREHSPETAIAWFEEAFDREAAKMLEVEPDINNWLCPGRTKPDVDLANRIDRGRVQVSGYIEQALASKLQVLELLPGEPAAEVPFTIDLDGITVIGYIDLIMVDPWGRPLVRDIKTGSKRPVSPMQLAVYRHAVFDLTGDAVEWGDYYMAKDNKALDPIPLSPYTRDMVTTWFKQMDASEKAGNYLPNPGDHCNTCPVRRFCSVMGMDRLSFRP
ncbi:RecB family exonuclease [Nonomuraea lactucae]|uniref:RecB family exonuclease n=1 Tax=Nonomuraea lactucae TaxID=2249762 RepID=UPI000DE3DE21|nr:PD-(D/E)XK nuclease family protein [Nonomuraea lactucae]